MANPAVTNVTGSNPGPQTDTLPDTVQLPTGNVWKFGLFKLTLSPTQIAISTAAEQTFSTTGIGLITTDFVWVNYQGTSNTGFGIVNARVSAADALSITFVNPGIAAVSPTTASFQVLVMRIQPNWAKQATGNQIDW
jgi:hypothetical protein